MRRSAATVAGFLLLAASVRAEDDAERRAAEHFRRGATFVSLQRYPEAIVEFEKGYSLSRKADWLHDIAQACADQAALEADRERALGYRRRAVALWREYLGYRPSAPGRPAVEERIGVLERQIARDEEELRGASMGRAIQSAVERAMATERSRYRVDMQSLLRAVGGVVQGEVKRLADENQGLRRNVAEVAKENERLRKTLLDTTAQLETEQGRSREKDAARERVEQERAAAERGKNRKRWWVRGSGTAATLVGVVSIIAAVLRGTESAPPPPSEKDPTGMTAFRNGQWNGAVTTIVVGSAVASFAAALILFLSSP